MVLSVEFASASNLAVVFTVVIVDIVCSDGSVVVYIIAPVVYIVPVVVVGVGVSGAAIVLAGVAIVIAGIAIVIAGIAIVIAGVAIVIAGVAIVIFVTGSGIDIVDDYISVATYIVDIVPVSKLTSDVATVVVNSGGNLPFLIPL